MNFQQSKSPLGITKAGSYGPDSLLFGLARLKSELSGTMTLFLRPQNRKDLICSLVFFIFLLPLFVRAEESAWRESLLRLLPSKSQLHHWKQDGPPETAKGFDLFKLINGGAEIYMEAGFKSAILVTFSNEKGKRINLEIFEMTSTESARKVHKKKIREGGKKVSIGDEALLEDYFINFRKGPFQVTLSGDDSETESVRVLLEMARKVAEKIQSPP